MTPFEQEEKILVSIIEDDVTIREGYQYLIDAAEKYIVVSAYASFEEAEKSLAGDEPDVIFLDIELPGLNGIEAIIKIRKILPAARIIMLTVYENEEMVFQALTNGASGYLTKNTPAERVLEAIQEAHEGGGPMTASIARMVISSFQKSNNSPLTKRETEILEYIAMGKSRGKIAKELFVDVETVKSHIRNIYFKLDVHSRDEAIKLARSNRFI